MALEQDKQLSEEKPSVRPTPSSGGEGANPIQSAAPPALPHRPGIGAGSVDITGIVPEGIRIDPDITEGHPGYQESGDSEIIPPERLTGGETTLPPHSD